MDNTRILFWNCRGVTRRRLELLHLISNNNVDIILLNETFLASHQNFNLPNFHSYHTKRPQAAGQRPSGGTSILINRRYIHQLIQINTLSVENTTIHIKTSNEELRIVSIYKRPTTPLITNDIEMLLDTSCHTIIAGDLNCKHNSWNSITNNQAGILLSNYIDSRNDVTIIAPTTPTHYPENPRHRPDILDIAIMKTGQMKYQITNLPSELSSDHTPIQLDIQTCATQILPPGPIRSTLWPAFCQEMNSHTFVPDLTTEIKIDTSISSLSTLITTSLENHTTTHDTTNWQKELPNAIKNEIKRKRRLRTLWQRTRDPQVKSELNRQNTLVHNLLHGYRDSEWTNFLGSIDNNPDGRSKLFKLGRNLLHKRPPEHPLTDSTGNSHYDINIQVEIFADTMEDQFKTSTNTSSMDEQVKKSIVQLKNLSHSRSMFFSPREVWNVIRKLPNRKAPGPDGITNCTLKNVGTKTITKLCSIFNGCVHLEYFPKPWKHAYIVMIPKAGKNPKIPSNHRPISLLNTMAKVFETLLLNRLKIYTTPIIRAEQFGFRAQHSTTLQLINFIDELVIDFNKAIKTAAILLDVEKAFDRVWHQGLIYKLLELEIPLQLTNTIFSFLSNRTFQIKKDSSTSSTRPILAGVPQGSCLSPHLFSLYINDMPIKDNAKVALFADDTLFYSSGRTNNSAINKLQQQLLLVEPWFQTWKISINPNKTSAILFSKKSSNNSNQMKIKNQKINWSKSIKYLGVHIDKNLNFSKHTHTTINKAKAANYLLFPLLNSKSTLSIKTKIYIFKTYIRPILLYAAPAWASNISNSNKIRLESFQAKLIRSITKSPWYVNNQAIRNSTKIPTIQEEISKQANNIKNKILNSPFNYIKNISKRKFTKERFKNRPLHF